MTLKKVVIAENTLDPSTWETFECENVLDFIVSKFQVWPETARLYHNSVADTSDITPSNVEDFERILKLEGDFYVVVYPGAPVIPYIPYIIALLILAYTLLNMPKVPLLTNRSGENPSPNNELSNRTNKARINGRIPDIYGQVRSVPDLIANSYKYFQNNTEREVSYMCIGRGEFDISDIREDTTLISDITTDSVEIYAPYTSPNSGDAAQLTIGDPIGLPLQTFIRNSAVNGQILNPQDGAYIAGNLNIRFNRYNAIEANPSSGIDFRTMFFDGDGVIVSGSADPLDVPSGHFNGTYVIDVVGQYNIYLVDPHLINANWLTVQGITDSSYRSPTVSNGSDVFVGPFIVDKLDNQGCLLTFVAPNGLFKDNGTTRTQISVNIQIGLTPVDAFDVPTGPTVNTTITMFNSYSDKINVGHSIRPFQSTITGRFKVECRRTTAKYTEAGHQFQQEVKLRDLYQIIPLSELNFGNVTTVHSLSTAGTGDLVVKERKLNMLATRKIPLRTTGENFTTGLFATKKASEIIAAICLDRYIGNRNVSELDLDSIYDTVSAIETYFGTVKAAEFCYTFDSNNLSFEEIISSVASSIFSIAYRRGNKIKLSFEKKTDTSTILFNHRNKLPGTETRNISFGNLNDNDGVEFQYIDPVDDSMVSLYFPEDKSAANPKVVESVGIRNYPQAYFNAKRMFNKIKHQILTVDFEATQEANIAMINDRILVSDGTRSGSIEGEVINQNVLELELSQNVNLLDGVDYTIFLQGSDGTVESMPITKTSISNKILLSRAPLLPLVYDSNMYSKTTFVITSNTDTRKTAFILAEKSPKGTTTSQLKAVNYDDRYYANDLDLINAIITE